MPIMLASRGNQKSPEFQMPRDRLATRGWIRPRKPSGKPLRKDKCGSNCSLNKDTRWSDEKRNGMYPYVYICYVFCIVAGHFARYIGCLLNTGARQEAAWIGNQEDLGCRSLMIDLFARLLAKVGGRHTSSRGVDVLFFYLSHVVHFRSLFFPFSRKPADYPQ